MRLLSHWDVTVDGKAGNKIDTKLVRNEREIERQNLVVFNLLRQLSQKDKLWRRWDRQLHNLYTNRTPQFR